MEWLYLAAAIIFEIAGTVCVKLSFGLTKLIPTLLILPLYLVCFVFLTLAVRTLPISVAYAIWAGLGTAIITIIGFLVFKEPLSTAKIACVSLIVIGVVGLHWSERFSWSG